MNDDIETAARQHPELTVVDWNVYSRSHPDWFQPDGLHLLGGGAEALATLLHSALEDLDVPLPPPPPIAVATAKLPDAREGSPCLVSLAARGGSAPYRWSSAARLPRGLHLTAAGRLSGVARVAPGTFVLRLRVVDAAGAAAAARFALRIRA